ncbi:MAG TPA: DNA-binding domain-containing protein [Polyangiaceae bacterium]|nr:DNA-binding domain-containing protein [Polyangiaceae bacterium]
MSLADLERAFWNCVRSRTPPPAGSGFVERPPLSAARRVGVYHHAYFARQQGVLEELFPRVRAALGPARFRALAQEYLMEIPSRTPIIERIGAQFPEFLRGLGAEEPVLGELAHLEWAHLETLLAPDGPTMHAEELARVEVERARWIAAPCVHLLRVMTGALDLWNPPGDSAIAGGRGRPPNPDEHHTEYPTPEGDQRRRFVVVTRVRDAVIHAVLSDEAGRALERLLSGATIIEAFCEFDDGPMGVAQAGATLAEFTRLGLWSRWEVVDGN